MNDPLHGIPGALCVDIRLIWERDVAGGEERFKETKDRRGVTAQRTISQRLKQAGIGKDDPRWQAVIEHGRNLYYGREVGPFTIAPTSTPDVSVAPTILNRPSPVTAGHLRTVEWMATTDFRATVSVYGAATEGRGAIYFRPTEAGLSMIGLHAAATRYVGFRTQANDSTCSLRTNSPVPTAVDARERWLAFEGWLTTLKGSWEEERGVIRWLRHALEHQLWLPEMGPSWAFLSQEWRFVDDSGAAKKTDILAVHLPTSRLGIVELKDTSAQLSQARTQVGLYGQLWERHARELAPFFTDLLRAQGLVYGNEAAAVSKVAAASAALFVGVATRAGVTIEPR